MGAATPTQLIDNERVRVTEWRFRPGEATGWHRHEFDYVVVPVTTGAAPPQGARRRAHHRYHDRHSLFPG